MLEIHEKKNAEGYEKVISQIGSENVRILESFSSGIVDGYCVYAIENGTIAVYDYDGSDLNIIDGMIRTVLFKGQFKNINECRFTLLYDEKYDKLMKLKFISESDRVINDINDFMNSCKKCKENK